MQWDHSILPQILAHKDLAALMGYPDLLDHKVSKETEARLVNLVHQDHMAPVVSQGRPVHLVLMEIKGRMDHLGLEDNREIRAPEDPQVCRECQE